MADPRDPVADLRRIATAYQTDGGDFWLLEVSGELVGTIAIRRLDSNVAEVKRFNVLSEHRGRGYGKLLLSHALLHATTMGFEVARLDTIRNPGPAMHLFARSGFREITRYNDNPDADVFMELVLKGNQGPTSPALAG